MNILKKISAAASIIAVAMLSSCSDKGYWDEAPLKQGLSFPCETYNQTLLPGENEIVIPITRTVDNGAQTVNVTFTPGKDCPTDITVPSDVTFAAGSLSTDLVIKVTEANPPYVYSGSLELDASASYSGNNILTLNCPVDYNWISLGTGTFLDAFVMGDMEPFPVDIEKAEGFERYRVLDPYVGYYTDGGKEDNGDWYASNGPESIVFWETENGTLGFNPWFTGLIYKGVKGQNINAYPWNAFNPSADIADNLDIWYAPGFAVLSPVYYIPGVGSFGQAQFAVQIELPE